MYNFIIMLFALILLLISLLLFLYFFFTLLFFAPAYIRNFNKIKNEFELAEFDLYASRGNSNRPSFVDIKRVIVNWTRSEQPLDTIKTRKDKMRINKSIIKINKLIKVFILQFVFISLSIFLFSLLKI